MSEANLYIFKSQEGKVQITSNSENKVFFSLKKMIRDVILHLSCGVYLIKSKLIDVK